MVECYYYSGDISKYTQRPIKATPKKIAEMWNIFIALHKSFPETRDIQSVNSFVSYFKLTIELNAMNSNNGIPIINKTRTLCKLFSSIILGFQLAGRWQLVDFILISGL